MAGCSARVGHAQGTRTGQTTPGHSGNSSAFVSELPDWLAPADLAEFQSGQDFISRVMGLANSALRSCMAADGFTYIAPTPGGTVGDFDNTQFPDFARMQSTGYIDGSTSSGPTSTTLPADQASAYMAAANRCASTPAAAEVIGYVRALDPLTGIWGTVDQGIQASTPVRSALAQFSQCIQSAGVPAAESTDPNRFLAWVSGQSANAAETQPQNPGPIVDAVDHHWEPIYVRCARPEDKVVHDLEGVARTTFLDQHALQIRQLEAQLDALISTEQRVNP